MQSHIPWECAHLWPWASALCFRPFNNVSISLLVFRRCSLRRQIGHLSCNEAWCMRSLVCSVVIEWKTMKVFRSVFGAEKFPPRRLLFSVRSLMMKSNLPATVHTVSASTAPSMLLLLLLLLFNARDSWIGNWLRPRHSVCTARPPRVQDTLLYIHLYTYCSACHLPMSLTWRFSPSATFSIAESHGN